MVVEMPSDLRGDDDPRAASSQHHVHHDGRIVLDKNDTNPATPKHHSTACLDGLRGLAAVTVFLQHWAGSFTGGLHEYGFGQQGQYHLVSLPYVRFGWHGGNASVVIFFVLSGYVLSIGPLQKLKQQKNEAVRYSVVASVLRRPLRLYGPALVVALIHAILIHIPGFMLPELWLKPHPGGIFAELYKFVTHSFQYLQPFQHHENDINWYVYNMIMWTMPIELKGSMLVYGILAVFTFLKPGAKDRRAAVIAIFMFFAATVMIQMCWKWSMADFIFGMFLAMVDTWKLDAPLLARLSPERRSFLLHTIFFAGGWVLTHPHRQGDFSWPRKSPGYVWLAAMIPSGYNSFIYYRYWQTWGALLTVYSVLRIDWLEKFFSIPSMRFLGRVSFMLYLTHLIFIRITGDRLHGLLGGPVDDSIKGTFWDNSLWMPDIGPMGLSTRWLTCVILVLPANLLLSKWFTEWIDDTIVNFAKRMTAGIRPPKRAEREGEEGESMLPMSRTRRNSL